MNSDLWGEVMRALNDKDMRTIAYDPRGHGRSSEPGRVNHDLLSDDLAAVLEARDLNRVTVVAHSCGAGEVIR